MNKHVFIIGLGLIGGSLALTIKEGHRATISAFDVSEEQLKLALALGVIDMAEPSIEAGAKKADLIIIATPVKQTKQILQTIAHVDGKPSAIIMDVGSTKSDVMQTAEDWLPEGTCFIGGHPMAGSHKSGVEAANKRLFENAFFVLTPSKRSTAAQLTILKQWLTGTRATMIEMDADEHDKIAGAISHFPHLIAAALVGQVSDLSAEHPLAMRMAAGGFRDITRIASSSPAMWRDIMLHNRQEMLDAVDDWQERMRQIKTMLENASDEELFTFFADAKEFRDALPVKTKGAIPSFYDLYVDVPDYPGVISEVTKMLADQGISITNLRIMETREDILGVLRLSFRSEKDRKKAEECLGVASYPTYVAT
ncbi:prephenate dehydrogenase [Aureibacillus halotolerans]|uniref:Prephenate dehydrogenase n=1 Tax=Aureibacillus halotolerans TaxID=1508390 RepID=A0A4R6U4V9_9BACI|nr:prephenate dehydrogenase [Aureibacillus halotolerans]TDQ41520.1 prephenate dehydrogenase [Aureibacillus halotolerans]